MSLADMARVIGAVMGREIHRQTIWNYEHARRPRRPFPERARMAYARLLAMLVRSVREDAEVEARVTRRGFAVAARAFCVRCGRRFRLRRLSERRCPRCRRRKR
jgi:hypothetical protein